HMEDMPYGFNAFIAARFSCCVFNVDPVNMGIKSLKHLLHKAFINSLLTSKEKLNPIAGGKEHKLINVKRIQMRGKAFALMLGFDVKFTHQIESQMAMRERYDLELLQNRRESHEVDKLFCHEIVRPTAGRVLLIFGRRLLAGKRKNNTVG